MVLENKQAQKNKQRKTQRIVLICVLLLLLIMTFIFKETIPQKIGQAFNQVDSKKLKQPKTLNKSLLKKKQGNSKDELTLETLCSSNIKWPLKELLLEKIFPQRDFETQVISENIFYKKEGFPNRIVRKTESQTILFQEDNEGFPSPVSIDEEKENAQILQFINGYRKHIVQRLTEYSNPSTSLVLNVEDNDITEIKLNSRDVFIECEDNQCRCDGI